MVRNILNEQDSQKDYTDINLSEYKVYEEVVDAIYLSWKEIGILYRLDLAGNPIYEKVRDLFVLGCIKQRKHLGNILKLIICKKHK